MTEAQTLADPAVPAHVPAHLVKPYDFRSGLGDRPQEAIAHLLDGPAVFWSPVRHVMQEGGAWVVTRSREAREVLSNPEVYSSAIQGEFLKFLGDDFHLGPLASDPPAHARYRTLVNPLFTPKKMFDLAPKIEAWCDELIDRFADRGRCDLTPEFADLFPTGIFIDLMGLPRERLAEFFKWNQDFIHGESAEQRIGGLKAIVDFFAEIYENPQLATPDSVAHYLLTSEPEGRPLSRGEFLGVAFLLFSAGLDTVVSSLGFTFRLLAENQELQAHLRANPAELPRHIEEMMRLFSPVTVQRTAVVDTELGGVKIKAGDRLAVSLACASRDPDAFPHPDQLDASRNPNPHLAFGFGIHRCVGAQLARRDILIALEKWFQRIPPFRLAPDSGITAAGGSVLCLEGVVLEWDAARVH